MRIIIKSALILLVFSIFSGCNRDGPLLIDIPIEEISSELDEEIPSLMEENNVKGLSIIVIRNNGQTLIYKSYGYANTETNRKIDEHTVFRAASLGKPIFAYIVLSLAKQGKIDIDKPLYFYLNEDVVIDDSRSRMITARMVLNHTTGLPNLDGRKSNPTFLFSPGEDFKYSGHAYLYLQNVVEAITGKDLDKLANEIVFRPLKMKSSSFVWRDKYRGVVSESYDGSGIPYTSKEKPEKGMSAWSLFTTIKDYSHFVSYTIETSSISGSVSQEMLNPNVDVTKDVKWGLGWGIQNTTPNQSFWHWGSMAGFRHYIVGYPKEKMAVIVMANSKKSFKIADDVMAKAIGGSYPSYDWF
jgi:CubicO group peptidase (beta-lactamase class C family)